MEVHQKYADSFDIVLPVVADAFVVLCLKRSVFINHHDTLRPKKSTYTQFVVATYFGPQQCSQRSTLFFLIFFSRPRCRKAKQNLKATIS